MAALVRAGTGFVSGVSRVAPRLSGVAPRLSGVSTGLGTGLGTMGRAARSISDTAIGAAERRAASAQARAKTLVKRAEGMPTGTRAAERAVKAAKRAEQKAIEVETKFRAVQGQGALEKSAKNAVKKALRETSARGIIYRVNNSLTTPDEFGKYTAILKQLAQDQFGSRFADIVFENNGQNGSVIGADLRNTAFETGGWKYKDEKGMHKEHACSIKLATKLVYSLRRVTDEKEPRQTTVLRLALAINYTGEVKDGGSVSPVKAAYNIFLSSIDNELEKHPSISFEEAWGLVYGQAKDKTQDHEDFNTNIRTWRDRAYNNGLKGPYDRLNNGMPDLFPGINDGTDESVAQCIRELNNILENYRVTTFPTCPPLSSRTSGGAVDFKEYPDILVDSINDGCFSKLLSDPRLIINQPEKSPPKGNEDRSTVISRLVNVLDSVWDTFYGDFANTITKEQITTIIESAEEKIKRLEDLPALPPNNNDNDNNNNNGNNNGNNNSTPWGEGYIPGNSRAFAATLVPNNSRRSLLPLTLEQARTRASSLPLPDSPFTFTGPGLINVAHGRPLPKILQPIKKIPTAFAGSTTPPFSPMVVNPRAPPVSPMGLQGGKTRRYRARRQTRRLRKSRGTMKRKQKKTRRQK
jgi:hypothetical protein